MCSFLIIEQRFGPVAVEMVPGKHSDFFTYLAESEFSVWRMRRGEVF
jgi:hypothetical protein